MAERGLLHLLYVEGFAEWLAQQGWTREVVKGEYEILRMRYADRGARIILYVRDGCDHATIPRDTVGTASRLVRRYLRERHRAERPA